MRRAAKVDDNQADIVAILRRFGFSVEVTSAVGQGCPDLVLGKHGKTYLAEIKDGSKPPSARKLTPDQQRWHLMWQGHVVILNNFQDCLNFYHSVTHEQQT